MLPGKKYTPEDLLAIARRRIWWLLVPLSVVGAGAGLAGRLMPDLYRSEALVLVMPQRVPESYVRSTVTTRIEDRLQAISQEILSRTRLEQIIEEFDLYADERRTQIMEDIVQRMRTEHVDIRVQKGDAFSVSFIGEDPRVVARVTSRLASFFIEENHRDRQVLAEGTNQFLEGQLEEARRRLLDHERRLAEFRQRHSGELPSQVETNLRAVESVQVEMQSLLQQIDRNQDRRMQLEVQLAGLQDQADVPVPVVASAPAPGESSTAAGTTAEQLRLARAALEAARLRLKPEHPDIQRLERTIRDLVARSEAEALQVPVSSGAPRSAGELTRERRVREITEELAKINRDIGELRAKEERLRETGARYQANAHAAPARESELTELMRDYTPLQTLYASLLARKEDARIAANLEQRQIGERFELLDEARIPERPFSPDRQRIMLFGLMAGLAFGLGFVGLLEYRDQSFKTDDEIVSVLSLPVLAVVPRMRSETERRRELRRRIVWNVSMASVVVIALGVLAVTYLR
jgi:polysaccharide chain length determinant protein (PEP-CTERM system associated)